MMCTRRTPLLLIFQNGGSFRVTSFYFSADGNNVNCFLRNGKCFSLRKGEDCAWLRGAEDKKMVITTFKAELLASFKDMYYRAT